MSIISCSTPGNRSQSNSEVSIVDDKRVRKKVLEEDEYLGRMAKIIKRDFFSSDRPSGSLNVDDETPSEYGQGASSNRTEHTYQETPGTDRTQSSTSTSRSRRQACSLRLNDFLEKYNSEDNEYFDKLQRKELRRHKSKYPWLYRDKGEMHNKQVSDQLKVLSVQDQAALGSGTQSTKMIDWPHNPMNSLFYPPSIEGSRSSRAQSSTVNYGSNRYTNNPIFKMPLPPNSGSDSSFSRLHTVERIGVDGKLSDGLETPSVDGYSFIPPLEKPATNKVVVDERRIKSESKKFYIPIDSPRDELAHRIYQEKVAKSIRTPKSGTPSRTPGTSSATPSSSRSYADFSFSPERIRRNPKARKESK